MRFSRNCAREAESGKAVREDQQGRLEDRMPSNHRGEQGIEAGILDVERLVGRCVQRPCPRRRVHRQGNQVGMGDGIDTGLDHFDRPSRPECGVGPDLQALSMCLGGDPAGQLSAEGGVELDRSGPGTSRFRNDLVDIGRVGDRPHPRHLPGNQPSAGVVGPGVGKEGRPGEERGIVDVGARDFAEQRVALQRGERAYVAGHVADRGDAAQQGHAQPSLGSHPGVFTRRVGRDVDVAVDQARDQISAGQVVDRGSHRQRVGSRREDRGDSFALNQH